MASMEDTSDCESVVGVFTLVKKVESKQKSLDYFKKGDIRKTIQLHGWQALKCCKTYFIMVNIRYLKSIQTRKLVLADGIFLMAPVNTFISKH
jgi:hypothetical protein